MPFKARGSGNYASPCSFGMKSKNDKVARPHGAQALNLPLPNDCKLACVLLLAFDKRLLTYT